MSQLADLLKQRCQVNPLSLICSSNQLQRPLSQHRTLLLNFTLALASNPRNAVCFVLDQPGLPEWLLDRETERTLFTDDNTPSFVSTLERLTLKYRIVKRLSEALASSHAKAHHEHWSRVMHVYLQHGVNFVAAVSRVHAPLDSVE